MEGPPALKELGEIDVPGMTKRMISPAKETTKQNPATIYYWIAAVKWIRAYITAPLCAFVDCVNDNSCRDRRYCYCSYAKRAKLAVRVHDLVRVVKPVTVEVSLR